MKNTIFEEMVNKKLNFIVIYTEDFENISLKSEILSKKRTTKRKNWTNCHQTPKGNY